MHSQKGAVDRIERSAAQSCAWARGPDDAAMATDDDISGGPTDEAVQATAEALNRRFHFRGTLLPRNDNRPAGSHQDEGSTRGAVREPGLKLGVMRVIAKMLSGILQAQAAGKPIRGRG